MMVGSRLPKKKKKNNLNYNNVRRFFEAWGRDGVYRKFLPTVVAGRRYRTAGHLLRQQSLFGIIIIIIVVVLEFIILYS